MTAAPGPQQPDEVRPLRECCLDVQMPWACWPDRCPSFRPAAPSAQPDDPIPPCTCGHREPSHREWGKGSCEALRCACGEFTPAQPVRDTGKGRRTAAELISDLSTADACERCGRRGPVDSGGLCATGCTR